MMESGSKWYVRRANGIKEGGFTDQELIALLRKGIVEAQDEIWVTRMEDWMKVEETIYSLYLTPEDSASGPQSAV